MRTIVIGFIGFFCGLLSMMYAQNKYSIIYHGPDSNEIKKQIFHCTKSNKYYKFDPVPYICPPSFVFNQ